MGAVDDLIVLAAIAGAGYVAYNTWFPGKSFDQVIQEIDSKIKQTLDSLPKPPVFQPQQKTQLTQNLEFPTPKSGTTTTGNVGNYNVIGIVGDFDGNSNSSATVNNMSNKGVEFIVGLGDYAYSGSASSWFSKIIGPKYAGKMKGALGNHDNDSYLEVFGQDSWTFPYSIKKGVLACAFIDADSPTTESEAEKAISAAKNGHAKVIVALHQAICLGGSGHHKPDEGKIKSWLIPLCKKYGVKAIFGAHEHTYQRMMCDGILHITSGAGGRSHYNNSGGLKTINGTYGFVRVAVGTNCLGQFIANSGGSVMDSFVF